MAEKTDLEKAVAELDAEVTPKGGDTEKKEPTLADALAKSADALADTTKALVKGDLVVSGKHVSKDDEGAKVDEPDETRRRNGGKDEDGDDDDGDIEDSLKDDDDIAKSFMESLEEHVELMDVSPALEALAKSTAAGFGRQASGQQVIRKSLADLTGAVQVLLKSHLKIHEALRGVQVKTPAAGVVGRVDGKTIEAEKAAAQGSAGEMSKSELRERVFNAVKDGNLAPTALSQVDSPMGRDALLSSIPEDVAKSYGIPRKSA